MTILLTCLALGFTQPSECARGGVAHPISRGGEAVAETTVDIGRRLAARRGWVGEQFVCLYRLWSRESGWRTERSKMASAGSDWRTNPATQIRWGLGYIRARYGSPCAAWANSQNHGYY